MFKDWSLSNEMVKTIGNLMQLRLASCQAHKANILYSVVSCFCDPALQFTGRKYWFWVLAQDSIFLASIYHNAKKEDSI